MRKSVQSIFFKSVLIFASSLCFIFGIAKSSLADQSTGLELVSCVPNTQIGNENSFNIKKDQAVVFRCTIKNTGTEKASALLLGKETKDDGNLAEKNSASTSAVELESGDNQDVALNFPSFAENGKYYFAFSLKNPTDEKTIGNELKYVGTLGEPADNLTGAGQNDNVKKDIADNKATEQGQSQKQTKVARIFFWLLGLIVGGVIFWIILVWQKRKKLRNRIKMRQNLLARNMSNQQKTNDRKKIN